MIEESPTPLTDAELREQVEQYRSVFEATTDGLVISDMEGYVVEANPAFCQMSGYSRDRLIGLHGTALTHPDSLYTVEQSLRTVREGGTLHYRGLGLRRDGSVCPAEVHVGTFTYKGQPHMLAVVRDITDRVQMEEQLREQEEQYRSIFEATSDGLIINDLETGLVVEVNPAFCAMHDYTRDELIGMHPTTFIHSDSHHLFTAYMQAVQEGRSFQAEAVNVRKDGSPLPIEVHGSLFTYQGKPHILGVVRDITERVQARELLEQRVEERTRELKTLLDVSREVASNLEMAPLLDLLLDGLQDVVPYDGAAVLAQEGEELLYLARRAPTPPIEPRPDRYFPDHMRPVDEAIMRGEVVIIDDVRADTPLGRAFQLHAPDLMDTRHSYIRSWMGVPIAFRGRLMGILLLTSSQPNFYTRHHSNLALAVAQHAAVAMENARLYEQSQELAALEERQRLARELHDSVTQALYGIGLAAETTRLLLEQDPARAAQSNATVQSLARAGMAEMRALLFELRPESLELEGLSAALKKQAAALEARYEVPIETTLCEEPSVSLPVKEALYRIAQEALQNAIKHAQPTTMEVRLDCAGREVVLEVQDDGTGFDPSGSFPGHLGLRSMKERATKLGGTLEIKSTPGKGTRVQARLSSTGRP